MDDKIIEGYIINEFESEFLDFKLEPYDWKKNESKEEFLKDVISLANSMTNHDRFLILGVKVKPDGERKLKGIDIEKLLDSSDYQQFITEHIEPDISIETKIVKIDGKNYGIMHIFNCNNRPYLIKKKYGNLDIGFIKTRRGSRNTNISRYFLDEIYSLKNPLPKSNFKIYGLSNGYITDYITLKKYDCMPDISSTKKELVKLFEKINNFEINDYDNAKEKSTKSSTSNIKLPSGIGITSTKKEIDTEISNYINEFAKTFGIKVNNNFYDLGNLTERFAGISSGSLYNIGPKYELEGSKMSKAKYDCILELYNRLKVAYAWAKFIHEIEKFKFIELAIKEVGNTSDEEIEIIIELPCDCYVDYEEFPEADSIVVKEINKNYSEDLFKPFYDNNISDYRKMPSTSPANTYFPNVNPLYKNESEIIEGIYDYIDYNVINDKKKTILNFTIKNIKENEIMAFPGKIILKKDVKELKYSIVSKKSKEIINGVLEINEI